MLRFSKKILVYMLMLAMLSMTFTGCNNDENASNDATTNDDGKTSDEKALEDAVAQALNEGEPDNQTPNADTATDNETPNNTGDTAASGASVEPTQTPIAERSPVEITRIEVPEDEEEPKKYVETDGVLEEEEHEVTPDLFPMDKCQVEVQGLYKVKLAKDLLKEVNKRRADRGLKAFRENPGLQACSDARCKEQTYFIGHFRPDGSSFDSVGRGYVQGECIAIDYRTVNDIMEAWFAVNESRYQIMHPYYTQCGVSIYDIDGIYYIAMEFGY